MAERRLILRHVVISACFLLLYLLLNLPQIILLSRIGYVAWYPASGLIVALLLGISPWYAALVSMAVPIAGKLIYTQPIISYSYTVDAIAIGVCYGAAGYVLRDLFKIDLELRHRRDVVLYVCVTSTAAVIAALIGAACLAADHSIAWSEYAISAVAWFLGDGIGLVGIAPFLLLYIVPSIRKWLNLTKTEPDTARAHPSKAAVHPKVLLEYIGQALALLATLWVMFPSKWGHYEHFYLSFIPIIWMAMRPGIRRVVVGLLVFNFGIAAAMHIFPPTTALFTKVALLMLILSTVGLLVGIVVSERQGMAADLRERTTYLNSLIENSPLAIAVLDRERQVELANPAFCKLFLFSPGDLTFSHYGGCLVVGNALDSDGFIAAVFAGNPQHVTLQYQRKDDRVLNLSLDAVPLLLEGEVRGAYMIYQDISEQISAADEQRQHAESLTKLVQKLKLHTEQMTLLNRMGDLLECSTTIEEACNVVSYSGEQFFPQALSGVLYLFRSSRNALEAAARWGSSGISEPMFAPEACWSLRSGQPHWSDHPGSGISCVHLRQSDVSSALCVPMVAQGNTLGVLHLQFNLGSNPACEPDSEPVRESLQRLSVTVAGRLALSLASLQLRATLREQSIRDPLTGLFNRRFMEETLDRELRRCARGHEPVSVLMIDVDHFKQFNDNFGHDAGDSVLRAISDYFQSSFRGTDICCRYGGEEFAIVLPAATAENAAIRAEALREGVKDLELQQTNRPLGQVTVSVGVAAFPEHGHTANQLLRAADACLYRSKSSGRDRVTLPLLAQKA